MEPNVAEAKNFVLWVAFWIAALTLLLRALSGN
jgi:hypothetical protein